MLHKNIYTMDFDDEKNITPKPERTLSLNKIVDELQAIERLSFEDGTAWDEKQFNSCICQPNIKLLLAKKEDKIIGYCIFKEEIGCCIWKEEKSTLTVTSLATHPAHRQAGVARALLFAIHHSKVKAVTLECRPLNESYYRKLGFVTIQKPRPSVYGSDKDGSELKMCLTLPIHSKNHGSLFDTHRTKKEHKKGAERQEKKADLIADQEINDLIEFCSKVRESTSGYYKLFFRSQRKECAFDTIISELKCIKEHRIIENKAVTAVHILRAIIHNALMVRGGNSPQAGLTKSGEAALALLKLDKYKWAKDIIAPDAETIKYGKLEAFIKAGAEKTTPAASYPYCHFAKM